MDVNLSDFHERLMYLIKNKNITPYRLSVESGVSEATLSRLIKGKQEKVSHKTLMLLSDYFQISPEWLRDGKGEMERRPSPDAADPMQELLLSQQRTIENLSETIRNLTSK